MNGPWGVIKQSWRLLIQNSNLCIALKRGEKTHGVEDDVMFMKPTG